jgi:phenylalanyl-tRNA synthetase beta subunit
MSISSTSRPTLRRCSFRGLPSSSGRFTLPCIRAVPPQIVLDGKCIGFIGELHPVWVQRYELGAAPVVFEIELDVLLRP